MPQSPRQTVGPSASEIHITREGVRGLRGRLAIFGLVLGIGGTGAVACDADNGRQAANSPDDDPDNGSDVWVNPDTGSGGGLISVPDDGDGNPADDNAVTNPETMAPPGTPVLLNTQNPEMVGPNTPSTTMKLQADPNVTLRIFEKKAPEVTMMILTADASGYAEGSVPAPSECAAEAENDAGVSAPSAFFEVQQDVTGPEAPVLGTTAFSLDMNATGITLDVTPAGGDPVGYAIYSPDGEFYVGGDLPDTLPQLPFDFDLEPGEYAMQGTWILVLLDEYGNASDEGADFEVGYEGPTISNFEIDCSADGGWCSGGNNGKGYKYPLTFDSTNGDEYRFEIVDPEGTGSYITPASGPVEGPTTTVEHTTGKYHGSAITIVLHVKGPAGDDQVATQEMELIEW